MLIENTKFSTNKKEINNLPTCGKKIGIHPFMAFGGFQIACGINIIHTYIYMYETNWVLHLKNNELIDMTPFARVNYKTK